MELATGWLSSLKPRYIVFLFYKFNEISDPGLLRGWHCSAANTLLPGSRTLGHCISMQTKMWRQKPTQNCLATARESLSNKLRQRTYLKSICFVSISFKLEIFDNIHKFTISVWFVFSFMSLNNAQESRSWTILRVDGLVSPSRSTHWSSSNLDVGLQITWSPCPASTRQCTSTNLLWVVISF